MKQGTKHKRKFKLLTARMRADTFGTTQFTLSQERMVKNFSSKTLSDCEEQVLALALNFASVPPRIPYNKIIVSTEATAKQPNASEAEENVRKAFHNAKQPRLNLDGKMMRAVKNLQKSAKMW